MQKRKQTMSVNIWWVIMGWNNPVVIQSMTNTPTSDIEATTMQIKELAKAGSELVRITVNDDKASMVVPKIVKNIRNLGIKVPIVWDFHYNWHILLEKYPEMAEALSKYRVNPGNVWKLEKKDDNFKKIIDCAIKYDKPVRIWVNGGSLDDHLLQHNMDENNKLSEPKSSKEVFIDSMVESALLSAEKAIEFWLPKEKIILSVKMSDIQDMVKSYELLSSKTDIALHLWLTEAGSNTQWITSSSIALGLLLQQWIWDTIRVSITPEPWAARSLEVEVCKYILQTMWIRSFRPLITSCPWCGRTSSDRFQVLSKKINDEISDKYSIWREKYKNFSKTNIAVMWCIVNGPWEAKHADIGIFFPWDGENPKIPVYIKWELYKNLEWERVYEEFMEILEGYLGGNI